MNRLCFPIDQQFEQLETGLVSACKIQLQPVLNFEITEIF